MGRADSRFCVGNGPGMFVDITLVVIGLMLLNSHISVCVMQVLIDNHILVLGGCGGPNMVRFVLHDGEHLH